MRAFPVYFWWLPVIPYVAHVRKKISQLAFCPDGCRRCPRQSTYLYTYPLFLHPSLTKTAMCRNPPEFTLLKKQPANHYSAYWKYYSIMNGLKSGTPAKFFFVREPRMGWLPVIKNAFPNRNSARGKPVTSRLAYCWPWWTKNRQSAHKKLFKTQY